MKAILTTIGEAYRITEEIIKLQTENTELKKKIAELEQNQILGYCRDCKVTTILKGQSFRCEKLNIWMSDDDYCSRCEPKEVMK